MTKTQPVDILNRHQRRNGRPHVPDPDRLDAIRAQHTGEEETENVAGNSTADAPNGPNPRRRRVREGPPPPNHLGHYPPTWRDCLEDAKEECRTVHALANPWPRVRTDLENSIMDSLTTVVMQKTQQGTRFETSMYPFRAQLHTYLAADYWPDKKLDMAKLVKVNSDSR